MKIYIASDHAGFELKESLKRASAQYEWIDLGPSSANSVDYPDYANLVCEKLKNNETDFAVLVCGSGQGMAMRANKYAHIRAALVYNKDIASLCRQHNNANVLCLGARFVDLPSALEYLNVFMTTSFEGGRHQSRVEKLSQPARS